MWLFFTTNSKKKNHHHTLTMIRYPEEWTKEQLITGIIGSTDNTPKTQLRNSWCHRPIPCNTSSTYSLVHCHSSIGILSHETQDTLHVMCPSKEGLEDGGQTYECWVLLWQESHNSKSFEVPVLRLGDRDRWSVLKWISWCNSDESIWHFARCVTGFFQLLNSLETYFIRGLREAQKCRVKKTAIVFVFSLM